MVKLFVEYVSMDTDMVSRIVVEGENFKEALFNLTDRTYLYVNRDRIEDDEEDEEREFSAEDIVDYIKDTNGEGSDYIVFMKDEANHIYINEYEIEEW